MTADIVKLIKTKLDTIEQRKSEQGGNDRHALSVYADYSLYFQGASEALTAAKADAACLGVVEKTIGWLDAEMAAADQRVGLAEALNS